MKRKSGDAKLYPGYSDSGGKGGAVDGVLIQQPTCTSSYDYFGRSSNLDLWYLTTCLCKPDNGAKTYNAKARSLCQCRICMRLVPLHYAPNVLSIIIGSDQRSDCKAEKNR